MSRAAFAIAAVLLVATCARAEIFKLAVPGDSGLTLIWWPVLPPVSGWTHDEETSRHQTVNMLVPNGQSFSKAPAVIYALASYKPRIPETHSVAELIAQDIADHKGHVPGEQVGELPAIRNGDGKSLRYFQFSPAGEGAWELVAYGEENEYFLLFVMSAQTKSALQSARPVFENLISRYKERPDNEQPTATHTAIAKKCTHADELAAEEQVDQLDSWMKIHRVFTRFAQCDDGDLAEGFSDSVAVLLAHHWEQLGDLVKLANANRGFENFVVGHLDETANPDDLADIAKLARNSCPKDGQRLCATFLKHLDELTKDAK